MQALSLKMVLLSCMVGLFLPTYNARADLITIVADDWCPMNCDPNQDQPGFMVEIARVIFEKAGHRLEYRRLPWSRAILESRQGKYNGIVGAFVGDAPDFIFPDNEQALAANSFFVLKDSKWTYTGTDSLKDIHIGVISEYDYGPELNAYIKSHKPPEVQINFGETALELNIKKLYTARIDALIEEQHVFTYRTSQMGLADQFKPAGSTRKEKAFIAFSPAYSKSKDYANILSKGMDEIRASGELGRILNKYGIQDWK